MDGQSRPTRVRVKAVVTVAGGDAYVQATVEREVDYGCESHVFQEAENKFRSELQKAYERHPEMYRKIMANEPGKLC